VGLIRVHPGFVGRLGIWPIGQEEWIPLIWEIGMDQSVLDAVVAQLATEIKDTDDFDALEAQVMATSRRVARQLLQHKADAKKGATEDPE
jgi:hypothetical protein